MSSQKIPIVLYVEEDIPGEHLYKIAVSIGDFNIEERRAPQVATKRYLDTSNWDASEGGSQANGVVGFGSTGGADIVNDSKVV